MKKLIFLISAIVLGYTNGFCQTCPTENIIFTTQSQIDNFQITYPGCKNLAGDLTINGIGIHDLTGLNILSSISGNLCIGTWEFGGNPNLTNLSGLNNITYIGGDLTIIFNDALTDLTGLEGLSSVSGCFMIGWNSLTNLAGLDGLTSVGGDLEIRNNTNLNSLTGFESLNSTGGSFVIDNNSGLTALTGLNHFTSIFGDLYIGNNPLITDLEGLNNLMSVGGDLSLYWNNKLTSLGGLEGLTLVKSIFLQRNNALINLEGLNNITTVTGSFWIGGVNAQSGNIALTSLSGLSSLRSIGSDLVIKYNGNLSSLLGLDQLNLIGGDLIIQHNNKLTALSGLENLDEGSIHGLDISYNPSLSSCYTVSICSYLSNPLGILLIEGNYDGCKNPEEVKSSCGVGMVEELQDIDLFSVFPNPASDQITITFELTNAAKVKLEIYNIMGRIEFAILDRTLSQGKQQFTASMANVQEGIYLCRLSIEDQVLVKKIIKR